MDSPVCNWFLLSCERTQSFAEDCKCTSFAHQPAGVLLILRLTFHWLFFLVMFFKLTILWIGLTQSYPGDTCVGSTKPWLTQLNLTTFAGRSSRSAYQKIADSIWCCWNWLTMELEATLWQEGDRKPSISSVWCRSKSPATHFYVNIRAWLIDMYLPWVWYPQMFGSMFIPWDVKTQAAAVWLQLRMSIRIRYAKPLAVRLCLVFPRCWKNLINREVGPIKYIYIYSLRVRDSQFWYRLVQGVDRPEVIVTPKALKKLYWRFVVTGSLSMRCNVHGLTVFYWRSW